jgi:hypothetical protein
MGIKITNLQQHSFQMLIVVFHGFQWSGFGGVGSWEGS